ncbi:Glyoxalase/bleomycin resistance protein/dioxygenase [Isoalcanivorax pacificus W11-5]|uniref:Glyoxalase/bleomycin resistance protein/dioxygenase n=1 Tax=Isoalcanivorax pacificus W11-5 TaxID=391936 RepID=A0A0B4XK66_9GAMM|nr:VOC family protein [Isoalcanivorax pacificus]AJD47456.1 Glyoxalase/bleomycin resistance protein/dioxygenase [Isoalcanivorax pacificus W11-5]
MAFKPDGYTSVAPYLVLQDAQGTIDFLVKVFAAERLRIVRRDDDTILHGEVRIDDTVIMLADGQKDWPAIHSHVHIYVRDVDDVYARAIAAGAESVQAPMQKKDPDRRGGFRDAGGTTWWVAQQTK